MKLTGHGQVVLYKPSPHTSCTDYCSVLCWSYLVAGGCGLYTSCCCILYQLALVLALTFLPCTCGVSLLTSGASIPLAQMVVVTFDNLLWWCFFIQPLMQNCICTQATCTVWWW